MTTVLNITRKTAFWLTLIFICVALFSLTPGQPLNNEFANYDVRSNFSGIIMPGLPTAVMLTYFGTIKTGSKISDNISIAPLTILTSEVFFLLLPGCYQLGFWYSIMR